MSALLWRPGQTEFVVRQRVTALVARSLGIAPASVTLERTAEDLGADSLDWAEIVLIGIEEEFSLSIGAELAGNLLTVGDLCAAVLRALRGIR